METLKRYWSGLQPRERVVLSLGGVAVALIFFYSLIWRPWHLAIDHMERVVQPLRTNLVWMRQQSENLKASGGAGQAKAYQGANQSLLSVVEQTAKRAKVSSSIQQMVPAQNGNEVRVVLEDVNFNQWIRWIDDLFKRYGVDIKQVSAERDDDKPNTAEVRVTFVR
jgi:general secretion pathway protein M